ncbi:MAG TPA: hypothetical protein VFD00_06010 [Thermoclostridium sp.]|nr:hypothetical protein [Thermoclostridium sp.]
MKKIRVPVTWECYGVVEVEVPDNLPKEKAIDMAIKIANDDDDEIPLPDDWEYVDNSWRVDDEGELTRLFYDLDYPEGVR